MPLTAETAALVNHDTLSLLQPDAILVNASRGGVVDQAALIEFLQAGRIAGAALDVFEQEPPASDNPLLQMENVIVTPHMAGAAREAVERNFRWGYENIQRVACGRDGTQSCGQSRKCSRANFPRVAVNTQNWPVCVDSCQQ